MACYCSETVRFKGRLVEVGFRYCAYNGATVKEGKHFNFDISDPRIPDNEVKGPLGKLIKLAKRQLRASPCPLHYCSHCGRSF